MKIALAVRRYDKRGGISRYVAELAERFAASNEVHVFANTWQDVGNSRIMFHKIPMMNFDLLRKYKKFAWNNIFEVGSFMVNSKKYINYKEFDIVHTNGDYLGNFDIYTAHSCHKAWLKLAKKEGQGLYDIFAKSGINPLHFLILKNEKFFFGKNNSHRVIISVSEGVKKEIVENYDFPEERIFVIPNGVDINLFNPEKKNVYRNVIREKHKLLEDDFIILFTAKQFERKGLKYLIKALPLLPEKVKLIVLGDDDPQPYQKLATEISVKERVIFVGHYSRVYEYCATSDIFVFPSLYEAFALAPLEAAASGLPVLITRVSGSKEIVKDGENGFFINRDEKEIARKVSLLYNNRPLLHKMSNEARKTAENYSWDKIAERTLRIYEEVCNEKRRRIV